MSTNHKPVILVTGASGRLGRLAVSHLLASDSGHVIAGSRDPEALADLVELGAETRYVNFDDAASLSVAFSGVDRLLLVSTNTIETPGLRLVQHRNAVKAAQIAGIKHIAYTSIMNPGHESPIVFAEDHRETENAIAATGLKFTFLRNSFYQENLLADAASIRSGELHTVSGEGRASYVAIADCARSAAAAISKGICGCYDITGSSSLTTRDLLQKAGHVLGKYIELIHLDENEMEKRLSKYGLSDRLVKIIISHEVAVRMNLYAQTTDSVRFLTGREPEPIETFLRNEEVIKEFSAPAI